MSFRTPICDLFEIEHPIFLAGMGQVAYAEVCAAVSEAGGYGTLGMAAEPPERIREEMRKVRRLTDKPFGVDLLAALPEQVMASIDVIIDEGASSFIAGLGIPGPVIERCHDAGVKVMVVCGKVEGTLAAVTRNRTLQDPVDLWRDVAVRAPQSWQSHAEYAAALAESGRCDEAKAESDAARRLNERLDVASLVGASCASSSPRQHERQDQ